MVLASSAVLGAAAGTGLALLVAMTIVVYRYYVVRQKGREWAELDRWEEEKIARKIKYRVENKKQQDLLRLKTGCCEFIKFSDIKVLISGKQHWKAHEHVLKIRSEKLLDECRKAGGHSRLWNAMGLERNLLRWVYTDSVVIAYSGRENNEAIAFMDTARFYNLTPLFERYERAMVENIDVMSCAYFHKFAKYHNSAAVLKCCNQLISRYYVKSKFSGCSEVTAETEMEFVNSPSETLMCELPPGGLAEDVVEGLLALNDDCLLHLFRFVSVVDLASIKGTCKRFSALADQCFRLYGNKSLTIDSDSMFGDIWILKHFGKLIESLTVDSFYERYATNNDIFEIIARHTGDKLKAISLGDCDRTEGETFEALKTVLSNVHRFEFGSCYNQGYNSNCDTLLKYCENLKEVKIDGGDLKLKSDWLLKNPNLTKVAIRDLLDAEILKEICRNCSRLECLSVCDMKTYTDELIHLGKLSSTLKQLEIDAGSFLTEVELQQFAEKTVLTDLTLANCHMTESLAKVLGEFPNLSNLTFKEEFDFDENIDTFSKQLTNINSLTFDYCDVTFEVIANMIKNLLDLKKLTLRLHTFPPFLSIGKSEYLSLRKIRNLEILVDRDVYEFTCSHELRANDWLDNIQVKPFDFH